MAFSIKDVEILVKETVFQGFFRLTKVTLRHRLFKGGWSEPIERELFDKASAAAAIVYDPVNDLIGLVEQFRVGMLESPNGPWALEGVAGMVDKAESTEALILREMKEEAGLSAAELIYITGFYPTPGSCNEYCDLYCAICDLSEAGGVYGLHEEGEDILFNVSPAEEVFDAMLNGRANNGATLIGLQWLQLNRNELREKYATERP